MARATKLRVVGGKTAVYVKPRPVKHALEVGSPCPNCGTALAGPWCYACGQKGEEFHRSIWHLAAEALEGLTHFDGRVWTTLPRLVLRPGRLTRDFLDGHRVSQAPPFRMFLVVLVAVFFAGSLNFQAQPVKVAPASTFTHTPEQLADLQQVDREMRTTPVGRWLADRSAAAIKNPEAYTVAVERWSHQFAILMLPIATAMLSLLFVFRRDLYVFDHLIFSMHSLAFQGLLLSAVFLGGMASPWAGLLLLIAPVHLFFHMRQAYRIGAAGTLVRMALLLVGSVVAFVILMMGLLFAGLATVH